MRQKTVLVFVWASLLLVAVFGVVLNVPVVWGSGTIYIRADGSVEGTDKIQRDGNIYTFTDNIYDEIVVQRDDIVIDGKNFTVQGTGIGRGIDLLDRSNVTVKNTRITNFTYGVHLGFESSNNTIANNIITGNTYNGINMFYSSNNTIANNIITANGEWGIYMDYYPARGNNVFTGNYIANNSQGFGLSSSNNVLRDNVMVGNNYNFGSALGMYNDVDASNTVDGKPIYYWFDQHDERVPPDAGTVYLLNCTNITIENLNLRNNVYAVTLSYTKSSLIRNVTATSNGIGVFLMNSLNNTLASNNIVNNGQGIWLSNSSYNMLISNNITANKRNGVVLDYYSSNNMLARNGIANNDNGVTIDYYSSNNTLTGNNITESNSNGVYIFYSSNNLLTRNNIAKNDYSVWLEESLNNKLYHNNFINNTNPAYATTGHANTWDDGYPSGGNYWSDYTGVDLYGGPYQNETGSDGIGDTPYTIDANNQDYYPLMGPFNALDAGVWGGKAYAVDVVSNSTVGSLIFDPLDGPFISFNVSGMDGTKGFSRVTVLKELLWAEEEEWTVLVGGEEVNYNAVSDESNTYLYFTYNHSTKTVLIQGTKTIPIYYLNITSTEGGTTNPPPGTYTYVNGTEVEVTAFPEMGFSFDYWLLDGEVRTENPITILMDADHSLKAHFVEDIPPTIVILSPENETYTTNAGIPLTFTVDESTSWIGYSLNGQPNVTITGNTTLPTLPDGWHYVVVYANDTFGNMGASDIVHFTVDTTAPTGSITINNGDAYTTSTSVTLTLTATDATSGVYQVRYSNDGVWDAEPWEDFAPTKTWTLTPGDGTKTVYYQIKDTAGLISDTYSDTIILDTVPPTGSITINDDSAYTNSTSVTLTLTADDETSGVAKMRFSNNGTDWSSWEPYATSKTWTLPSNDGTRTVYVQFMDKAGLFSPSYQDTITLDTTKPTANAGADQTVNAGETVNFDAGASSDNIGVVSYEWDFGDGTTGTGVTTSHVYSNTGTYTVTLTVKDAAGNTATDTTTVTVQEAETPPPPSTEGFPIWMIGATVATAAVIVAATAILWKKRK